MSEVTDWISAIGQAVGAIATGGALLIGAVTFRRQYYLETRAQASAVIVGEALELTDEGLARYYVKNGSSLPIYSVTLSAKQMLLKGSAYKEEWVEVLLPGAELSMVLDIAGHPVTANFTDSDGSGWDRDRTGYLASGWAYLPFASSKPERYRKRLLKLSPDDKELVDREPY